MSAKNPRLPFRLFSLAVSAVVAVGLFTGISVRTAEPAKADTGVIVCDAISCSVSKTAQSTGGWNDADHSGGSGSSSGGTASPYRWGFTPCIAWVNISTFTGSGSYPAQNSGRYSCSFNGRYSAGQGSVDYPSCPPQPDRAAKGRSLRYFVEANGSLTYTGISSCAYPTDQYAPVYKESGNGKVYTGGRADFFITHSNSAAASVYNGGGTSVSNSGYISRAVDLNNPKPYTGGWGISWNAQTQTINGSPVYGFYRLQTVLDYRICRSYDMPSWLHQPTTYNCDTRGQDHTVNPYTYACNIGTPALRAGIVAGAIVNATDCAKPYISCSITGQFTINGVTTPTEVMRDNKNVPARLGTTTVNANPSYIDIDKVAKFMTITVDNRSVSPSNPDGNVNSSKPYYSMWQANGTTKIKFGEAVPQAESIFLSWLTDSAPGRSWQATETASLRALAYLPTQTGMAWVPIEPVCSGALTSNPVSAVRSVNNH